jgi:hypothetical protein
MLEADVRGKYEAWGARRTDINLDRAKMNGWERGTPPAGSWKRLCLN